MKFSHEYKQRIFDLLGNEPNISTLMNALEDNDDLTVRLTLEMYLDKTEQHLKPRILDQGDRELWNGTVRYYKDLYKLYSEFMAQYTEEIDNIEKVTLRDFKAE